MKEMYPERSIGTLCALFGKTRHAYYDHNWTKRDKGLQDEIVIQLVLEIRGNLPRLGTRKLLYMLAPKLTSHQIKLGRDYLFALLDHHRLLIRQRKRKAVTTNSHHWMRKYLNLIKNLEISGPEQLWVSDITYVRLRNEWGYLSLICDAYSHRVMGFGFRTDLSAEGCLTALEMALSLRQYPDSILIHHSDRGCQYCCATYVDLLIENKIGISMTENSDPRENAIAERLNGIIKNEFYLCDNNLGFEETYKIIAASIKAYNELRPHGSCDFLTPMLAHQQKGMLRKRWKNYPKSWAKAQKAVRSAGSESALSTEQGTDPASEHKDEKHKFDPPGQLCPD